MDVSIKQPGGGGDMSPPSSKKPKFKFNRKTVLVVGGVGVVLLVVIMKATQAKQQDPNTVALSPYGGEYGTNPVQGGGGGGGGSVSDGADTLQYVNDALSAMQTSITGAMDKNNQEIYETIQKNNESFASAMQNLQQQQGSSGSGAEGMIQNLASEIGGILDKQQSSISGLESLFQESLAQQNAKFEAMDQANLDMYSYFDQQLQGLIGGFKETVTGVPETKIPTSKSKAAARPPVTPSNSGLLITGSYSSRSAAEKVVAELSKIYGASDAYITSDREGVYRAVGNFADTARATKVGQRLQQRNLLSTAYTGPRAGELSAIPKAAAKVAAPKTTVTAKPATTAGFLQTGTFKSQADANKVAAMITKDYGGSNVKVVKSGTQFRVQSNFASSARSSAVLNRLQTRKVIKTGTAK